VGAEVAFLVSFAVGARLLNNLFRPLALVRDSARLLAERDFATRFRPVGQPEIDELIHVYNGMADGLREERVRQQEQQNFLRQVLDGSPSGILTLDVEGRVDYANPAALRLLQVEASDALGQRLKDLASPLARAADDLAAGGSTVAATFGGRRVRCVLGSFVERGFPRRFVLLEELTEELRRYERLAYEKLIRLLSHEVNNSAGAASSLLHSCLNYAPQLRDADREDYENAVRVVITRIEHLLVVHEGVRRRGAPAPAPEGALRTSVRSWRAPSPCGGRMRRRAESRGSGSSKASRVSWLSTAYRSSRCSSTSSRTRSRRSVRTVGSPCGWGSGKGAPSCKSKTPVPACPRRFEPTSFTPFFTTKPGGQGLGLTLVKEVLSQHGFEYSLEGPPGGPTRFTIFF
jgi:PAS domain-containing protein